MQISGKYLKAWKLTEQNGFVKVDLGDSNKKKDGSYDNFTWFGCNLVGNAKTAGVREGDTVEVKSGIITMNKGKDAKWYTNVTIFEIERTGNPQASGASYTSVQSGGFQDEIPF